MGATLVGRTITGSGRVAMLSTKFKVLPYFTGTSTFQGHCQSCRLIAMLIHTHTQINSVSSSLFSVVISKYSLHIRTLQCPPSHVVPLFSWQHFQHTHLLQQLPPQASHSSSAWPHLVLSLFPSLHDQPLTCTLSRGLTKLLEGVCILKHGTHAQVNGISYM